MSDKSQSSLPPTSVPKIPPASIPASLPISPPACPIPLEKYPVITMAHGGGGLLMHQLIDKMFRPTFESHQSFKGGHDSVILNLERSKVAFTTDSFVVKPLKFPGGDIGKLAICGTVNDLAMSGARPKWLSASFILEEGFSMQELWTIVSSMATCAREASVSIVTGDTKVIERKSGDGIYINTAGVGEIEHDLWIHPLSIAVGDDILISSDIGRHGIAVMASRENLQFQTQVQSDVAPLHRPILALLNKGISVRCLRDCTRGGLATSLNEIAIQSNKHFEIIESQVEVNSEVVGACELLGLDPLYVANEGCFILFLPSSQTEGALSILRGFSETKGARCIGRVVKSAPAHVIVKNAFGSGRVAPMLSGEQLPRIC